VVPSLENIFVSVCGGQQLLIQSLEHVVLLFNGGQLRSEKVRGERQIEGGGRETERENMRREGSGEEGWAAAQDLRSRIVSSC
jgi:hypothetical protein